MRRDTAILGLTLFALAAPASGQQFRFGVKGGVPLTTYFETGQVPVRGGVVEHSAATRRYTVGPSAEWRPTPHFGLDFEALYRRIGYVRIENTSVSGVTVQSAYEVNGYSLDFPMLARYRAESRIAPYVSGGLVLRHMRMGRARGVRTVQTAQSTTTSPIDSEASFPLLVPGATGAVGLEFAAGRIRFLPELRYTRWRGAEISGPLRLTPNQVEFLLGVLF